MGKIAGIDHFSKELELMLFFISRDFERKNQFEYERLISNVEWDHFIQLVLHHRVFPIIYKRVSKATNCLVPPHVMEKLKKYYQNNILKMLMLSGESESISEKLGKKNIRSLFLKGPTLAEDLYGDISFRTSSDIDILIPIEDLELTEMTLLNLGYSKDDYILSILNDWKWRHHHITFFHPDKKIKVEIHWRLNPGPSRNPSFEELWKRKKTSSISNNPVNVLGYEDLFIFLTSHGARHGWSRLRWLLDIDMLIQRDLDWGKVIKQLSNLQITPLGGQALILANELLGSYIPTKIKKLTETRKSTLLANDAIFYIKQMINLHDDHLPAQISTYHQRHLFVQMSIMQKILFVMSFFYPYAEDAQTLPLPKSIHFLYFPLRPILWVWRKRQKQASF